MNKGSRTKQSRKTSLKATIKDQSGAGKTRIGEILSKEGQITSIQLKAALDQQKKTGGRLSSILLSMGYIDPDTIINVLGRIYNYDVIRLTDIKPSPGILKLVPFETAKKYMAFPLTIKGDNLVVTMTEPTDIGAVEEFQRETGKNLELCVSTENDIIEAYRDFYKISEEEYKEFIHFDEDVEDDVPVTSVEDFGSLVSEAAEELEVQAVEDDTGDEFMASDAPIIKLVNGILIKAISD